MTVPEDKIPAIDDRPDSDPGGPPGLSDELIDELLSGATTARAQATQHTARLLARRSGAIQPSVNGRFPPHAALTSHGELAQNHDV